MNEFLLALRQFFRGFRCWIVVSPWEQALQVRLGKRVRLLGPGFHWKLPVADVIYLQSVRQRISPLNKQTISTSGGQVVTVAGSLGYQIRDIARLYGSLHHAEDTLASLARAIIAKAVAGSPLCAPQELEAKINAQLDFSDYGLSGVSVFITEFAVVRTYRLIGDYSDYGWGKRLATDAPTTSSADSH